MIKSTPLMLVNIIHLWYNKPKLWLQNYLQ